MNFEIIELKDISKTLDQTLFKSNVHENGNLSNKKAILEVMLAQQEQLQATSGNYNYPTRFFVRHEASEVGIRCQKCAEPFPTEWSSKMDHQPTKLLLHEIGKSPFKDLQWCAEIWSAG